VADGIAAYSDTYLNGEDREIGGSGVEILNTQLRYLGLDHLPKVSSFSNAHGLLQVFNKEGRKAGKQESRKAGKQESRKAGKNQSPFLLSCIPYCKSSGVFVFHIRHF